MITEDYVSFETAKLLKEKGFDEECRAFWKEWDKQIILCHCSSSHMFEWCHNSMLETYYNDESELNVAAPTLQMTMKWLREVHHLVIQIEFIDFLEHGEVWLYSVIERKTIKQLTGRDEDFTEHSYEEACEAAIKYCLENLV